MVENSDEESSKERSFHYNPNNYLRNSSKSETWTEYRGSEKENKRGCSSEKEHKVNALAPRAEEGRDYLRKAAASWK